MDTSQGLNQSTDVQEHLNGCPSCLLHTEKDLPKVATHVRRLGKPKITQLGVAFGLDYQWISDRENNENYHLIVVNAWLKRQDHVESTCVPTWGNFERVLRQIEPQIARDVLTEQLSQPT